MPSRANNPTDANYFRYQVHWAKDRPERCYSSRGVVVQQSEVASWLDRRYESWLPLPGNAMFRTMADGAPREPVGMLKDILAEAYIYDKLKGRTEAQRIRKIKLILDTCLPPQGRASAPAQSKARYERGQLFLARNEPSRAYFRRDAFVFAQDAVAAWLEGRHRTWRPLPGNEMVRTVADGSVREVAGMIKDVIVEAYLIDTLSGRTIQQRVKGVNAIVDAHLESLAPAQRGR